MGMGAARVLLPLCALLAACAGAPAEGAQPVVRAAAEGAGNAAEVAIAGRAVVVDLWSNRGIGAATVTQSGGPPPASVALRLHLWGMEELRLSYGETTLVAAIASGPGHAVSQHSVAQDGSERPLAPGDPGWLEIAVVAAEPDPPFPLRVGHIAVALPADVFAAGEGALGIRWVDFFR